MNALYKTIASVIIMSNFINPLAYAAAHTQTNTKEIKTKEINRYSYAVQNILQEINHSADYLGIKWVKGGVESASKYNLSIFSVLSETSKNVIFTQGRFDYSKEIGKTLNIGFGSRQLFTVVPQLKDILGGDEIMLGANVFFDSKSANKGLFSSAHRRYSVGLELQAPKYDFYGNIYRGQSDFINNERVLSGYDFGVVANIPTIPNAKVSVSRYDFSSDVTEKTGNKFRAEYYVNAGLSFGGEYDKSDQNNSSSKLFMKVHFTNNLHHFGNNSDDKTYTANTVKVWDKRYNEVKRINEVYVEKRLEQIIEIENPIAVEWDTSFDVADLVTGVKGGAKVTYSILDAGNTGARINEAGVISGTTQPGTVKAKISIAATNKYAATSREIDVEFIAKDIEGESVDVSGEQTLEFGTTSDTPNQSGWWKVADHGEITYEAVLGDVGGSFDGATGVISNTEAPGTVTVTVKIAGGTKYKQGVVGTYDVVFTKSKKDIEGELVTVDGEQTLEFGETSATPNQSGWWNENEHGLLEYEAAGLDVTGGGIDEATGVISDTTAPGTVTVMVVIKGGTKYTAGDIGTFDVEFIAKDAADLEHGIDNQAGVKWGSPSIAPSPDIPSWAEETHGEITYEAADLDATGGEIDPGTGVISDTTASGTVTVTVAIKGGTKYAAGDVGTFTVEFIAKDIEGESVDVSGEQTLEFGTTSDTPNQSGWWKVADHGEITYEAVLGDVGGSFDGATGVISNTEAPGTVTVTVKIAGGTKYKQGVVGTYDVVFTKSKKDIEGELVTVDGEQTLEFGTTSATPNQSGWWNENEHGLLEYEAAGLDVTGGGIDFVTGVISDTTAPGTVTVMVVIKGGTKYTAGDIGTYTVKFIAKDASGLTYTIDNQTDVKWGTSSDTPAKPDWVGDDGYGDLKYKANLDATGGQIDEATGEISDTTDVGTVTVTAFITGGTKYAAGDVATFTVDFVKKAASGAGLHGNDEDVEWGTSSAQPLDPDEWAEETHGEITYEAADLDATGGEIDFLTGVISDTTASGTVTVTVKIDGGTKYAAGDVGTYTVKFIAKDASGLTYTIDNQTGVKWGTSSDTPAKPDWVGDDGYGDLKYKANLDATGGQIDEATGEISDTTDVGTVTVTAFITGGTKYAAGDIGTFDVEFIAKDAADLEHGIDNQAGVKWGSPSIAPSPDIPSWAEEHGEITYETADLDATGGQIDFLTGVIRGTTAPGTVTVTVWILGGTKYKEGDAGTYDVVFTKKTGKTLTPGTITKTLALNNDIFAQELLAAITDAESGSTVKSVSITSGSSVVLNTDRTGVIHLAAGTTILAVTLSNDLYKDIAVEVTVTIN